MKGLNDILVKLDFHVIFLLFLILDIQAQLIEKHDYDKSIIEYQINMIND